VKRLDPSTSFPEARVLVVDDEERVASVLTRFLDLLGCHADGASSGRQALEMLRRNPYDVAILDLRMPGMDGVELMHRVHEMCPNLAIIFLTGHATLESAVAAVKSHAVDYLFKPVSMSDLAAAIAAALQRRAQGERLRAFGSECFLEAGPVTLDREKRQVIITGAEMSLTAKLTPTEVALLGYLMQHAGTALSCYELAQAALKYEVDVEEARNIIRIHICRLRKKIEPDPACPRLILTAPNKCYLFDL
jgi:DNA-binding response OmpR family regulator